MVSYNGVLSFKDLLIIPSKYQVFFKDREITMTAKEFQILVLLVRNKGQVFTKAQIYDQVWGDDYVCDSGNIAAVYREIEKAVERLYNVWIA